jgi:predicted metal-dependent RNase
MMKILKIGLVCAATMFSVMVSNPLQAEGSNGIIAIPYQNSDSLVIIDTNSKKILLYSVSGSKGLSLKEVRSFEMALQVPTNVFTSKGLSGKTEKKDLSKFIENE